MSSIPSFFNPRPVRYGVIPGEVRIYMPDRTGNFRIYESPRAEDIREEFQELGYLVLGFLLQHSGIGQFPSDPCDEHGHWIDNYPDDPWIELEPLILE